MRRAGQPPPSDTLSASDCKPPGQQTHKDKQIFIFVVSARNQTERRLRLLLGFDIPHFSFSFRLPPKVNYYWLTGIRPAWKDAAKCLVRPLGQKLRNGRAFDDARPSINLTLGVSTSRWVCAQRRKGHLFKIIAGGNKRKDQSFWSSHTVVPNCRI
jgi:hypothetical protein